MTIAQVFEALRKGEYSREEASRKIADMLRPLPINQLTPNPKYAWVTRLQENKND